MQTLKGDNLRDTIKSVEDEGKLVHPAPIPYKPLMNIEDLFKTLPPLYPPSTKQPPRKRFRKMKDALEVMSVPAEMLLAPPEEKLKSIICPDLPSEQQSQLLSLLMEFENVFSRDPTDLGFVPSWIANIKINVNGSIPYQAPYSCPPHKRVKFVNLCNELESLGIIEPSTANGGSPAFLVDKPDGTYRLVVDYREVNDLCIKTKYPRPRIDDCLAAAAGKQFYMIIDFAQGYYQCGLSDDDRAKTVFVTPDAKYQYRRLPMGFSDAPYYFQNVINELLGHLQYICCVGYFGNIVIMGSTWEGFLENIRKVLLRCREFDLRARTLKCKAGVKQIKFLGHIVDANGIRPNPSKVDR